MKPNYKPFDIEAAKNGAKVITRDGRPARIICFDAKSLNNIIALVEDGGSEEPINVTPDGEYRPFFGPSNNDLFMVPVKREGWTVICHGLVLEPIIYERKEDAEKHCKEWPGSTVVKVEWEE